MKKSLSPLVIATICLALLAGCGEDKAREAAKEAALETAQTPPAPTQAPAETVPPAAGNERATSGTIDLAFGSQSGSSGKEVCLPVTARNFNQIVSMQYTMKWDTKVLKFKGLKSFGLPGLSAENFGTQLAATQGLLTYSWYDANVKGINLASGATLYEVCFEAVGPAGSTSSVAFVNAPVIFEITNGASQFLELRGAPGKVDVK